MSATNILPCQYITINDLPTEVLEALLQFSAPRPHLTKAIVRTRRVCRRWKQVIDGCPFFWTEVTFTCGLGFLPIFLERSKNVPLSLKCELGLGGYYAGDLRALQLSLCHAQRWKSADITIWPGLARQRDISELLPFGPTGMPALLDLKLSNTRITSQTANKISSHLFPRLRSLRFVDVALEGPLGALLHLEELTLVNVTKTSHLRPRSLNPPLPLPLLLQTLRGCSKSLKVLSLSGEIDRFGSEAFLGHHLGSELVAADETHRGFLPVELESLDRLSIMLCRGETAVMALRAIHAPNCRVVKVIAVEYGLHLPDGQQVTLDSRATEGSGGKGIGSGRNGENSEGSPSCWRSPVGGRCWGTMLNQVTHTLGSSPSRFILRLDEKNFTLRSCNSSPLDSTGLF